jgi:hypothetical protein
MAGLMLFRESETYVKILASVTLVSVIVLSGCSSSGLSNLEGDNSKTLITVAQNFNDDYRNGDFGSVYDRWDARSRAIISRANYILRHVECPNNPQSPTHVSGASQVANRQWLVRYTIGDSEFVDHWSYFQGRWQFDLIESNPDAMKLYELPFANYALEIGCVSS